MKKNSPKGCFFVVLKKTLLNAGEGLAFNKVERVKMNYTVAGAAMEGCPSLSHASVWIYHFQ